LNIIQLKYYIVACCIIEVLTRNVAVKKSVGSSSVFPNNNRTAEKANNGLINSNDFYRSVNDVGDQWWRVDLDTQYFILGVLVFNRDTTLGTIHTLKSNPSNET